MTDWIPRLLAFSAEGETLTRLDDLSQRFAEAVEGLGFRSISTNLISVPGRSHRPGILFGHGGWSAWSRRYARLDLAQADPAMHMLRTRAAPFTWREAQAAFRSPQADAVMEACRDYTGLEDALVLPIRDADQALLSVTLAGDHVTLESQLRRAIMMAGFTYALRGRELVSDFKLDARCVLSTRQLDCLRWVDEGKTDEEIGRILGISARTVHNHVEAAKTRLGVSKRAVAARVAWRRGWLV